jgi:hypothetical protein
MNHDARDSQASESPKAGSAGLSSPARRREVLRTLGKASAAAGAAGPLSAMAGGSGRPWCYKDKTYTTCTNASISGAGSVIQSVAPGSTPHGGKPCSHYGNSSNVPSSCSGKKFKELISCSGSDSKGVADTKASCLFNRTVADICSAEPNSQEAHWITAYCNAVSRYSATPSVSNFPYSPSEVNGFYGNANKRAAAYSFFTTYMENA